MNKVDVKIMAVKPRRKMVLEMCEQLGLSEDECVIYDDRPNGGGPLYTCRKCWFAPVPNGVTHRVVLQDDLDICDNFVGIMNEIVNVHPEFIFSLYCSRMRFEYAAQGSPYVIIKGRNAWGQGMMMPISYVKPMFDFADAELGADFPYDDGIYAWWAEKEKLEIMTTIPSTIQHLCPNNSTLGYNNKNKVSKVWIGRDLSKVNWKAKAIAFSPSMPMDVTLEQQKQRTIKSVYTVFKKDGNNVYSEADNKR